MTSSGSESMAVAKAVIAQYYQDLQTSPASLSQYYETNTKIIRPEYDGSVKVSVFPNIDIHDLNTMAIGGFDSLLISDVVVSQVSQIGNVDVVANGSFTNGGSKNIYFKQSFSLIPRLRYVFSTDSLSFAVDETEGVSKELHQPDDGFEKLSSNNLDTFVNDETEANDPDNFFLPSVDSSFQNWLLTKASPSPRVNNPIEECSYERLRRNCARIASSETSADQLQQHYVKCLADITAIDVGKFPPNYSHRSSSHHPGQITGSKRGRAEVVQSDNPDGPIVARSSRLNTGHWTKPEHILFLDGVEKFGEENVKEIAKHVGTRNERQVIEHGKDFFQKPK